MLTKKVLIPNTVGPWVSDKVLWTCTNSSQNHNFAPYAYISFSYTAPCISAPLFTKFCESFPNTPENGQFYPTPPATPLSQPTNIYKPRCVPPPITKGFSLDLSSTG